MGRHSMGRHSKRRFLRPAKPLGEMSDDELDDLAEHLADRIVVDAAYDEEQSPDPLPTEEEDR